MQICTYMAYITGYKCICELNQTNAIHKEQNNNIYKVEGSLVLCMPFYCLTCIMGYRKLAI